MLHDEQLFAGVQARIGLYLLVGQRTKFLAAALGEEERAVDDVIRYAIAIPQEAVFWKTEDLGFFVAQQQDIVIFKRFDAFRACSVVCGKSSLILVSNCSLFIFASFHRSWSVLKFLHLLCEWSLISVIVTYSPIRHRASP